MLWWMNATGFGCDFSCRPQHQFTDFNSFANVNNSAPLLYTHFENFCSRWYLKSFASLPMIIGCLVLFSGVAHFQNQSMIIIWLFYILFAPQLDITLNFFIAELQYVCILSSQYSCHQIPSNNYCVCSRYFEVDFPIVAHTKSHFIWKSPEFNKFFDRVRQSEDLFVYQSHSSDNQTAFALVGVDMVKVGELQVWPLRQSFLFFTNNLSVWDLSLARAKTLNITQIQKFKQPFLTLRDNDIS